jgi:lysozyme family protein
MPRNKSKGAATVHEAHELQKLMIQAAIEQLERERQDGEVKAQTLSAIAKIVKDTGVEIDWLNDEVGHLNDMLSGLKLDFSHMKSVTHS